MSAEVECDVMVFAQSPGNSSPICLHLEYSDTTKMGKMINLFYSFPLFSPCYTEQIFPFPSSFPILLSLPIIRLSGPTQRLVRTHTLCLSLTYVTSKLAIESTKPLLDPLLIPPEHWSPPHSQNLFPPILFYTSLFLFERHATKNLQPASYL